MAISVEDAPTADHRPDEGSPGRPRRALRVLLIVGATLVILVIAAVAWFFLGRESASEVTADDAVAAFRAENDRTGAPSTASGVPAAGVYAATASGNESIGIPGFDESYGPNAPVTVTHGEGGCFAYRVDFNSHHWRSWTFCPSATATLALTQMDGWTARQAPGFDLSTVNTYVCNTPVDVLWSGAATGDAVRNGACTGTTDLDDSVTDDAVEVEVVGVETTSVDGEKVDVVHVRSTETFGRDQSGRETDEWWLDASSGLPVRLTISSSLSGGSGDYAETADVRLTTLTPES